MKFRIVSKRENSFKKIMKSYWPDKLWQSLWHLRSAFGWISVEVAFRISQIWILPTKVQLLLDIAFCDLKILNFDKSRNVGRFSWLFSLRIKCGSLKLIWKHFFSFFAYVLDPLNKNNRFLDFRFRLVRQGFVR